MNNVLRLSIGQLKLWLLTYRDGLPVSRQSPIQVVILIV